MRIFIGSDARTWQHGIEYIELFSPDVVLLLGDLTGDGPGQSFYRTGLKTGKLTKSISMKLHVHEPDKNFICQPIPVDMTRFGLGVRTNTHDNPFFRKKHIEYFYSFLKQVSKIKSVKHILVIKGNHEEDGYSKKRIERIQKCREISGEKINIDGVSIAGLSYDNCEHLKQLRPLLSSFGNVDIICAHPKKDKIQIIAEQKPRLLACGHLGTRYLETDGVPIVRTDNFPFEYAVIDFGTQIRVSVFRTRRKRSENIRFLSINGKPVRPGEMTLGEKRMEEYYALPQLTIPNVSVKQYIFYDDLNQLEYLKEIRRIIEKIG